MKYYFALWFLSFAILEAAGQISGTVSGDFSSGRSYGPNQHLHQLQVFENGSMLISWPGDYFSGFEKRGLVKLKPDGNLDNELPNPVIDVKNYRPHLQTGETFLMESVDKSLPMIKLNRDFSQDLSFNSFYSEGNFFPSTSTGFMQVPWGKVGVLRKFNANGELDRNFHRFDQEAYSGFLLLQNEKFLALHLDSFKLRRYTSQGVVDRTFNCNISFSLNGRNKMLITMKELGNGDVLIHHPYIGVRRLTNTGALASGYSVITPFIAGHLLAFDNGGAAYIAEPFQGRWQLRRHTATGVFDPSFVVETSFSGVSREVDDFKHRFFLQGNQLCYFGLDKQFQYRFVKLLQSGTLEVEQKTQGLDGPVNLLLPDGSKKFFAAGQFTQFKGRSSPGIIRILPSGEQDTLFRSSLLFTRPLSPGRFPIKQLSLMANGQLVVLTDPTLVAPRTGIFNNLHLLQANGDTMDIWQPDTSGMGGTGRFVKLISALAGPENTIYALISLQPVGFTQPKTVLYRYLANGEKDISFIPYESTGLNGLHRLNNGDLFVSQSSRWRNDPQPFAISQLLKIRENGSLDTNFEAQPITSGAGGISNIQKVGSQYLLTTVAYKQNSQNNRTRPETSLIKLEENGSVVADFSFSPVILPTDTIFDNTTMVLANQDIGTVLPNQSTSAGFSLMRRNAQWEVDTQFVSLSVGFGLVQCMVQMDSLNMLVGGSFSHFGDAPNYGLAKVVNRPLESLRIKSTYRAHLLQVYPNPGTDLLHVSAAGLQGKVHVFDQQGKCMYTSQTNGNHDIHTHTWKPGLYYLILKSNEDSYQGKWMKQQ